MVTLTGTPTGGTFKIDGTTATTFNPSVLNVGSRSVVYSYTDGNGCSNTATQAVTVNALPVVAITGLNAIYCKNATPVTLTGNPSGGTFKVDGSTATTFTPSVLSLGNHTVMYTYADANGCSNTTSQTVNINPVPTATISGTASMCKTGVSPKVTFTGAGGTAPYTFTYRINSGSNVSVTTTSGNSVNIDASTSVSGVFVYTLISVQDASTTACNQLQTGAATITITGGAHVLDPNFVAAIRRQCPTCLDPCNNLTPAADGVTSLDVRRSNIADFTGLEGFINLQYFNGQDNVATIIPNGLANSLAYLECGYNRLTALPTPLPTGLQYLHCSKNQIPVLPALPNGLLVLYCNDNPIAVLPALPTTLVHLYAYNNRLTALPTLPQALCLLNS